VAALPPCGARVAVRGRQRDALGAVHPARPADIFDDHLLADLRGKKVNFGPAGTGASLTGTIVFQRLGINVEQVMIDQPTALQKLQSGQVDAIARVIPKPIDFFGKIPASSGLHLVNIPFTKTFEDLYTLGEFTKQDYPTCSRARTASTRSRCRPCSPCSIGRRTRTAITASNGLSNTSSAAGIRSSIRHTIRNGAM
jgi:ABC-type amino acid transport substrate-binding protein